LCVAAVLSITLPVLRHCRMKLSGPVMLGAPHTLAAVSISVVLPLLLSPQKLKPPPSSPTNGSSGAPNPHAAAKMARLLCPGVALAQLRPTATPELPSGPGDGAEAPVTDGSGPTTVAPTGPSPSSRPRRFYGSVEIDMVRPVKAFDSILNAVVMELQRTKGAKITLTLEIEATADDGFAEADIGVVRDNARQLKFKTVSTGFE
jgi:hypothetical protein